MKGVNANRAERADRRSRDANPIREDDKLHGEEEFEPWLLSQNLVAPDPRPGYVQRWVRVGIQGVDDASNYAKAAQMGWHPRSADSVKGLTVPTIKHGEHAGVIGVHGMVLMERPKELDDRYKRAVENRTKLQTQAVVQRLAEQEREDMPITYNVKSQVQRGKRVPAVADDGPPGDDLDS